MAAGRNRKNHPYRFAACHDDARVKPKGAARNVG